MRGLPESGEGSKYTLKAKVDFKAEALAPWADSVDGPASVTPIPGRKHQSVWGAYCGTQGSDQMFTRPQRLKKPGFTQCKGVLQAGPNPLAPGHPWR